MLVTFFLEVCDKDYAEEVWKAIDLPCLPRKGDTVLDACPANWGCNLDLHVVRVCLDLENSTWSVELSQLKVDDQLADAINDLASIGWLRGFPSVQ